MQLRWNQLMIRFNSESKHLPPTFSHPISNGYGLKTSSFLPFANYFFFLFLLSHFLSYIRKRKTRNEKSVTLKNIHPSVAKVTESNQTSLFFLFFSFLFLSFSSYLSLFLFSPRKNVCYASLVTKNYFLVSNRNPTH